MSDVDFLLLPDNKWRHVKTGGEYRVLFSAMQESDRTIVVVYQSLVTKEIWTRPLPEFYDGRFVQC